MQRLVTTFKDVNGLHSRIATYLNRSSVLRLGLVPLGSRSETASVLTALVDEPIQKTNWSEAVASRPLTKDVLVTQSPAFTYVETKNSLLVYPVPFPGPAVEYLEANSYEDSWDHLKTCHLLLFLGSKGSSPPQDPQFPWLYVLNTGSGGNDPDNFMGEKVIVDSQKALEASAVLQKSPANASQYMRLKKASNIGALQNLSASEVYRALEKTIFRSCEQQISELPRFDAEKAKISVESRQSWANLAHRELQGTLLPAVRAVLNKDFAAHKLYARSDDVDAVLTSLLATSMQEARAKYLFLLGKVSPNENVSLKAQLPDTSAAVNKLAKESLKSVLVSLGIQVPIAGVAIAGCLMGLSWYSMTALALLGAVCGLRKLQTLWLKATESFESQIADVLVSDIQRKERQLWSFGEQAAHEEEAKRLHMVSVLDEAKRSVESSEK